MSEREEVAASAAVVGYVVSYSILASLIRKNLLSPREAIDLIDEAILNLEKLDAIVGDDQSLLRRARADLETTLATLRAQPGSTRTPD
jgi:20S proteasome alpha/beta subunit